MQRQIKFRAWDGKHMINPFCELKEGNRFWGEDLTNTHYGDIQAVMQFTGLFDKNGKEIWEGDIIERSDSGVIEFDGGMFGVNWDFGTDKKTMLGAWGTETNLRCLHDGYNREIEVIGNIYENTDLLK